MNNECNEHTLNLIQIYNENQKLRKYNLNILDELHANENAHTRIFLKLLKYKYEKTYPFLQLFIDVINANLDADVDKISFEGNINEITGQKDFIDGYLQYKKDWAIIIENKVEGACDQENQIDRYVETTFNYINDYKKIYVVYLTATDEKKVSEYSLHKETKQLLDYTSENHKGRFIPLNYKDHVLPIVNKFLAYLTVQNIREPILEAAVEQYSDYLTGRFGIRQQDLEYYNKMIEDIVKELGIKDKSISDKFNAIDELQSNFNSLLENIKYFIYPNEPKRLIENLYNDKDSYWYRKWADSDENKYWTSFNENIYTVTNIETFNNKYYWGLDFIFEEKAIKVCITLHDIPGKVFIAQSKSIVEPAINSTDKVLKFIKANKFTPFTLNNSYYFIKEKPFSNISDFKQIYDDVKMLIEEYIKDFEKCF